MRDEFVWQVVLVSLWVACCAATAVWNMCHHQTWWPYAAFCVVSVWVLVRTVKDFKDGK